MEGVRVAPVVNLLEGLTKQWADLILEDADVQLAKENRVPNVTDEVRSLLHFQHKGRKKHYGVPDHNVGVTVIDCDLKGLLVFGREVGNRFDDITYVTGR